MTKLEYEKRKRIKTLALVAGCCMVLVLTMAAQESYNKSSLWIRGGVTILLCGAVLAAAFRYWAANDEYRIAKRKIIRRDGQMPFLTTFYFIQHKVLWWVNCKDQRARDIRFRSRRDADKFLQKTINDWNSPYNIKSEKQ